MKRVDIANKLTGQIGLSKEQALQVIEIVMEEMTRSLTRGENVFLRGFGTFSSYCAKETAARNIMTGERVVIPACRKVKFKPSKYLKYRINGEV